MESLESVLWLLGEGAAYLTTLPHAAPALRKYVDREVWVGTGPSAACYIMPARQAAIAVEYTAAEGSPQEAHFRRLVEEGRRSPVKFVAAVSPTAVVTVNVYRAIVLRRDRRRFEAWARHLLGREVWQAIRARQP
ncbi:hypothetical protein HRbin24_00086 [bacterium HR24]|nr:hypothetical protein HRbin24_00086 [bacterium HR24]